MPGRPGRPPPAKSPILPAWASAQAGRGGVINDWYLPGRRAGPGATAAAPPSRDPATAQPAPVMAQIPPNAWDGKRYKNGAGSPARPAGNPPGGCPNPRETLGLLENC